MKKVLIHFLNTVVELRLTTISLPYEYTVFIPTSLPLFLTVGNTSGKLLQCKFIILINVFYL